MTFSGLWTIFRVVFVVLFAWSALADASGARRYQFPALRRRSLASLLLCISFIISLAWGRTPWADITGGIFFAAGMLLEAMLSINRDFTREILSRGITPKKLLLFQQE